MSASPDSPSRPPATPRRRWGCWTILGIIAGILLLLSLLPRGPQHRLIRDALHWALVRQTGREVWVGTVRDTLWGGVEVDGLRISEAGGFTHGTMIDVKKVGIRWNLFSLLFHLRDPLQGITSLVVDHPDVKFRRTPDGAWELVKLFQPKTPRPETPFTYGGRVQVIDGTLRVIDEVGMKSGWSLAQTIQHINALATFNGRGDANYTASLGDAEVVDSLAIDRGKLTIKPFAMTGELSARGLHLDAGGKILNTLIGQWARLEGGQLNTLTGPFSFSLLDANKRRPNEPVFDVGVSLTAEAADVSLHVTELGRALTHVNGYLGFDLARRDGKGPAREDVITFRGLSGLVGTSSVLVDGRLNHFTENPAFDLRVRSNAVNVDEVRSLLPGIPVLKSLHAVGSSQTDLRLTGTLEALRIAGWAEPHEVRWDDLATIHSGRVRLDLRRVPAGQGLAGVVGRLDLEHVAARTAYTTDVVSRLTGTVSLGRDALAFNQLRGYIGDALLRLNGRILNVTTPARMDFDLDAQAAGLSPMAVAPLIPAAVRPLESRGGMAFRLRLRGPRNALAVAGNLRLPWFRTAGFTHLGGAYDLALQLGDRPTGRVAIADAGVIALGTPITAINGAIALRPSELVLTGLRARVAGGPARADGTVSLDGRRFDLGLHASGIDLAQATRLTRSQGIVGRGPASADLRLRGSLDHFALSGSARAAALRVPGAAVSGLDVTAALDIRPRLGLAGLSGRLNVLHTAVAAQGLHAPVLVDRARLAFAGGRITLSPLVAHVNGDPLTASGAVRVASGRGLVSLDLAVRSPRLREATIRRVAGPIAALDQVRLVRPAAIDLRLTGSLARLRVAGHVAIPQVRIAAAGGGVGGGAVDLDLTLRRGTTPLGVVSLRGLDLELTKLGLPLTRLAGDLRFAADGRVYLGRPGGPGLTGRAGESLFALQGSVGLSGPEPSLDLTASVSRLRLQDVRTALNQLEQPPEITGEGELGPLAVRITGVPSRLRVATLGPGNQPGGWLTLPQRLAVGGYTIEGGRASFDVLVAKGKLAEGDVDVEQVGLTVAETGTRAALDHARLRVANGRLERADVLANVGGGPLRVVGGSTPGGELALRVQATDVALIGLMPRLAALHDNLQSNRVSSDLTVVGPMDDLAIAGRIALGGYDALPPAQADVHLRLVAPLQEPGGPVLPRQILGGVTFVGGALKLAALQQPITDLRGEVVFSASDILFHDLQASIEGSPLILSGAVVGLPKPVFDLSVRLPGLDLGRVLAQTCVTSPTDPHGPQVDVFTAHGLPRVFTPEPVSGTVTLVGPQEQVAVGVDLRVPLLTIDPARAMPDARGMGANDPQAATRGVVLMRDARLTGSAVGSLTDQVALLPGQREFAAALGKLTGLTLVADRPADPAPAAPSLLDRFQLALHFETDQLHPRQALAFLSENVQQGFLKEVYALQPGRAVLDVLGPANNPQLRGGFDLHRLDLRGVPVRELRAQFDYFNHLMTLSDVALDIRGGTITGHGSLVLFAERPVDMQMQLQVRALELAALNQADVLREKNLNLDGVVNGGVQFHLAENTPRIQAGLTLGGLRFGDERLGDAVLDVGYDDDQLIVQRFELNDPESHAFAHLRGRAGLTENGALDLVADVRNFDLARLNPLFGKRDKPLVSGQLDLVAAVTGTRQLPMVTGSANVFFGSVDGLPFNRLSLRSVQTGPDSLKLTADVTDTAYRFNAGVDLTGINVRTGELRYQGTVDLASVDLSQALPLATGSTNLGNSFGQVHGKAQFSGRVAQQTGDDGKTWLNPLVDLTGFADLSAGDAQHPSRLQVGGVTLDTARIRLEASDDTLNVQALEVTSGTTRIGIDPNRPNRITSLNHEPQVELQLVSDELHYQDIESLTRLPLQTTGYLTLAADVFGPLRDPVADLQVASHDLAINGEVIGNREIRARLARGVVVIDGTQTFELFGVRVALSGEYQPGAVQSNLELDVYDFERLRTFLTSLTRPTDQGTLLGWQQSLRDALEAVPKPLAGRLHASLRVAGNPQHPTGYVLVSARDLHAGDRPFPGLEVMVNLGTPQPRQPDTFEPGVIYLYGSAVLGSQAAGGALRLQARTDNLDLAPFAVWSDRLRGLQGRVSLQATATGTTSEPRIEVLQLVGRNVGVRNVALAEVGVNNLVMQPGRLDLGTVYVRDGSLDANVTGTVPLIGTGFSPNPDGQLNVRLVADVRNLAEFRDIAGSIGDIQGQAHVDLALTGTMRAAATNGTVQASIPRLQLVHREAGTAPRHQAQVSETLAAVTSASNAVTAPTTGGTTVVANLVNTQLDLAIQDNTLTVNRFYVGASTPAPPGAKPSAAASRPVPGSNPTAGNPPNAAGNAPGAAGPAPATPLPPTAETGEFEIASGGTIQLPRRLDLTQLGTGQNLAQSPARLQLRARNFDGELGPAIFRGLNLAVDVVPVFSGGTLNQVVIRQGQGWVNGGFVQLGGTIGLRNADLARGWPDQFYNLTLSTPPLPAGVAVPADFAGHPLNRAGGEIYPITFSRRGVFTVRMVLGLKLETREGQTPPMTLSGTIELRDAEIKEGALALFAGRDGGQPAQLPAFPQIDLTILATENNWIRAKVPELTLPLSATVRLSQTPQQLKVDGTATAGEGQLNSSFLKNRINIRGGQAQFTLRRNPVTGVFEPFATFSARADTDLSQAIGGGDTTVYHVQLNITGSARPGTDKPVDTEFVVQATSNPPLAEEQIFAMLSRREEFATALQTGQVQNFLKQELANAALQTALSYALTPVFDELRRAFGLDVFTVRFELDRPLEIQASKYLFKHLYLTMIVEVGGPRGTNQTVRVDYEVAGGVRFGVQFDSQGDFRGTGEWSTRF